MILEWILLAAALYNYALVFIILWRTHQYQAGRNFAWYLLGIGTWTLFAAILVHPTIGHDLALWFVRATFATATCFSIAWLWFCVNFPVLSPRYRLVAIILTGLGIPWLYLAWTTLLIDDVIAIPWSAHAKLGPMVPLFTLWLIACGFSGLIHLAFKQAQVRGFERLQLRYILLGGVGLIISGSFPDLILPTITHNTAYSAFGPLAILFVSTTTTYAIVRYRLMDINIVIRASLVYSLTIGCLSLLFALLVPVLNDLLRFFFKLPIQTGTFIMAFLIALAFQPLRQYIQQQVDLRFFKSVYDYRIILSEAGNALATVRDSGMLVTTLTSALVRALRPRGVAIYLPNEQQQLSYAPNSQIMNHLPLTLSQLDPVVKYATSADEVLIAEEYTRLPEPQSSLGRRMKEWGVEVVIPLIAGDRVGGIVFLGEKLSEDIYTSDDVSLLRILGKQAVIALDNARHYDEIALLNEYHERLLHTMQDGVVAIDPELRIITFNPTAERITGVTTSQAVGRRLGDIGLSQLPTSIAMGESIETVLTRQGRDEVPVLVTVTPFRRRWDNRDSHLIVFRDLSRLRALEQEKMQAERFSSMGAMAASLAHEIKNPLVPIRTFAHLLPSRYDDAEFREEFSYTVVNEVERINRLVGEMLDLVLKPTDDHGAVDIQEIIDSLLVLNRVECERLGITIDIQIADNLPVIQGVTGQIYQSIHNVVTNAIQVMPDGGTLRIAVHGEGDFLVCRISDTGPGVAPEELSRIFEPLYTTKVGGHGLGLALTYQFVRSHGGEVHAECSQGTGLTITLLLPADPVAKDELLCS